MSQGHSPLPWRVKDDVLVTLVDANGETIATFAGERKQRLINAALVLEAVNREAQP
jgi:hypothetical protein